MSSHEINAALILHRINEQEKEIEALRQVISALSESNRQRDLEAARREKNQLLAGISFLGAVITTLAGVIWSYRGIIFKEM
jgi:hypothetical protein